MEVLFQHLVKSSVILFLFLVSYYVFLKKETFFSSNRLFLIGGLLTSFFLPFVTITKIVYVAPAAMSVTELVSPETIIPISESPISFNWTSLFLIIYLLGLTYFTIRFILQLRAIHIIKKNSDIIAENNFYHVQTSKKISPFSFFKHIFYHPNQFSNNELQTIISHEKVHATGLHSLDILITEIIFILMWFNPAIWFYKTIVKQNLEFLADSETCNAGEDKKYYQYLMLKQATEHHKITIVNPFFNSIIKKRIVMLNQNQSKRINLLKLLIVLPFLGIFLVGFNTKEIVKFSEESTPSSLDYLQSPDFYSPLKADDIIRISSDFGPAKSPFSKEIENHTGIDLVSKIGKTVSASANGTVRTSNKDDNKGNYIVIEHSDGYSTKYMHLKDRSVVQGEKVKAGDRIGHVGNTGKSTGPHLHFEILKSTKAINPTSLIPFKTEQALQVPKTTNQKASKVDAVIELTIDKNSTDAQLLKMKANLAKEGIDFSYTTVRNDASEIISLEIELVNGTISTATYSSMGQSNSDKDGIEPVFIFVDTEHSTISIGKSQQFKDKSNHNSMVWVSSDSDSDTKEIIVTKVNGKKVIMINGEEMDKDELEEMDIHMEESSNIFVTSDSDNGSKKIKIRSSGSKNGSKHVYIHTDSENDEDIQVIGEKNNFLFIDSDGKEPLYVIDGKNSTKEEMKNLSPSNIATINVLKGKAAKKKYGKKAKNGVVEITTKKK